jgi:cation diffusion facilitator family transporter
VSETNGTTAGQVSRRSVERTRRNTAASRKTVLVALASNVTVAIVKLFGGLVSGSTAMLAEAAHSLADTANQAFLLVSIALGSRDPSPDQPFGYAQMRFLWTFMAAVGMFLAGAVFAIGYGVYELIKGEQASGFAIAYITLAIAFAAEGASWLRALKQVQAEAREAELPLLRYVRGSRDPNVKMVLFEDSAALIGIFIAFAGILLDQLTGSSVFDPAASVLIGILLVVVAVWMGRDVSHLLIGGAARPDERADLERALREFDEVDEVVELLTMALGPNSLLVAARIDLADNIDADRLEQLADHIDERLREVVPDVTEVFLDPTRADFRAAHAAPQPT